MDICEYRSIRHFGLQADICETNYRIGEMVRR